MSRALELPQARSSQPSLNPATLSLCDRGVETISTNGATGSAGKMGEGKHPPFDNLRYLYVGSKSVQKDLEYYTNILGAEKVWDISSSGTRVAAVRLGKGPLVLLADHRPPGSCIMIFQVEGVKVASEKLRKRGWKPVSEEFVIP